MAERFARTLQLQDKTTLSPSVVRLVIGGDELADFPPDQETAHVKFVFPRAPGDAIDPAVSPKTLPPETRPFTRSYTIRRHDPRARTLTIDIVNHGRGGPGGTWLTQTSVGDTLYVAGPGGTKFVDFEAAWFALGGDLTALPSIAANLERLPATARGVVLLETPHPDDAQELKHPPGMEVRWFTQSKPDAPGVALADAFEALQVEDEASIWFAGELSAVRRMKAHLKSVPSRKQYVSSYWQYGSTDEEHRVAKKQD